MFGLTSLVVGRLFCLSSAVVRRWLVALLTMQV
jgi:hypothetical protein